MNAVTNWRLGSWGVALAFTCSCVPTIDDDPSLAFEGQVLAVQFEPAEAKPETQTQVNALVASADPEVANDVVYSLCVARKPLSELGPVHPACLSGAKANDALQPLGKGTEVQLEVPKDACSLFGPQRPAAEPGQPPGRPVDPDATGGFYQPVIADLDSPVLGSLRLDCGLPGGSQAQVAQYNQEHEPNRNPSVEKLQVRVARGDWQTVSLDGETPLRVPRNKIVTVRSNWSKRERYLHLSAETSQLTTKNEVLVASFYSTVGGFDEHRVKVNSEGRVESELRTPNERGEVQVWVVVRDGRSGSGWVSFKLDVR